MSKSAYSTPGKKGKFDPEDLIDIILQKDETSRFIVKKIWKEFSTSEDWKRNNIETIKKRMSGWQLTTFNESYENKIKEGISLFKKSNNSESKN